MKVLYIGCYRDGTGWAQATIDYILSMDAAGIDVVPRPIKLNNNKPDIPKRIIELEKKDSIGSILSARTKLNREDGLALIGCVPVNRSEILSAGAHFISYGKDITMENDEGWMTSVAFSPSLGHSFGLGFIKRGAARLGETGVAADPVRGQQIEVEIVSPHFIDPEGERLRA